MIFKNSRRKLVKLLAGRPPKSETVTIDTPADLLQWSYWTGPRSLRLRIPPCMMRMQGAFGFDENHPFVQALTHGAAALERFYTEVSPKNLAAYYGLEANGRLGADLPAWEIPWYQRIKRTPPPGEAGLRAKHGLAFYGPVTKEKIATELARLRRLSASIKNHGYDPDGHGDIVGYILKSGDQACFFVRGGKHRAGVLAHHGLSHIPVKFRADFPRVVDLADVEHWPMVAQKKIDAGLAGEILGVYLKGSQIRHGFIE